MFVPHVATTKSVSPRRPASTPARPGGLQLARGQLLQRKIGNQALGRLLTQSAEITRIAHGPVQGKLKIGTVNDPLEHEADRVAAQVMRMPAAQVSAAAPPQLSRKCAECEHEEKLQRKSTAAPAAGSAAPAIVHDVLRSPGRPLDAATRGFFEPRFGTDFSDVRVHTDTRAARSAEAVQAQAYTAGTDHMVFGAGRYLPHSRDGQHLLAHELAHVVQQRDAGASHSLQRFHLPHGTHTNDETSMIAPTFKDMLATIRTIITASTQSGWPETVAMEKFVELAGGHSVTRKLDAKLGIDSLDKKPNSMLNYRYLFTCRCGLIDMLHFIELLYISNFVAGFGGTTHGANLVATRKGREHELDTSGRAASESRFGPEDTPSNALGAFTAEDLAAFPRPGPLFDAIKDTLVRCSPIDFNSLSAASQGTIVHHYGELVADPKKPGDLVPKHQNETAIPDVLNIRECSGERSFPFSLDTGDADRKTISDTDFGAGSTGLKSGSDMRDFVATQRPIIIQQLSSAEKVRMVKKLFSGTIHDSDIDAISVIYRNSTAAEKAQIKTSVDLTDMEDPVQFTRMKELFAS